MATMQIISPLTYIDGGQAARLRGEFIEVTDPDTLYMAFISFCEFMSAQFYRVERFTKRGDDVSTKVSVPLLLENFWLYAHINRSEWDELKVKPDNVAMCTCVEDAFNAQQIEGSIMGLYVSKMVTVLQQRAERFEVSGAVAIEQITGMRVV